MKKYTLRTISVLIIIIFTLPFATSAQDGSLDLTFDTDGIVTTSFGSSSGANAIAIQADGKIVVAGTSQSTINLNVMVFTLMRYNTNGSLDLTFDTDGIVTTSIGEYGSRANAIVIQADGKIVVAGESQTSGNYTPSVFALTRYNTNGSLDSTFNTDGIVTTSIGINSRANGIALQADGKIVLAGFGDNNGNISFALARYNANGGLDNTFDTDGIVTTSIGIHSEANAIAIQADGKIVVAGFGVANYISNTIDFFALTRYNANGSLDTTFGIGGIVSTWIDPYNYVNYTDSRIYHIALQADGKIVAAGYFRYAGDISIALTRYNTNGSLDTTFGIGGIVTQFLYSALQIEVNIAIQADGKILLAGYLANGGEISPYHFWIVLTRFNTNGSLDNTFDTDGIVSTSIGTNSFAKDITIQADGKIVVAGAQTSNDSIYEFTVVRYNNLNATGLNTFSNHNTEMNIYPNPTTANIYLSEPANISLSDLSGKLLLEQKNTNQLDLSSLPAGMYFLSFGENNNQIVKVRKE